MGLDGSLARMLAEQQGLRRHVKVWVAVGGCGWLLLSGYVCAVCGVCRELVSGVVYVHCWPVQLWSCSWQGGRQASKPGNGLCCGACRLHAGCMPLQSYLCRHA